MRVLWFTPSPGLFSKTTYGTWVEALQLAAQKYSDNLDIGLCFEYEGNVPTKVEKDGFTYYPVNVKTNLFNRLKAVQSPRTEYKMLRALYMKAIMDFKPDIIQCFGTELWHYGLLAKDVNIPMVVHIMGFQNIYYDMDKMVQHKADVYRNYHYNPFRIFRYAVFRKRKGEIHCQMELEEMKYNHYFMGRTEWDKNIVKYLSPRGKYYYCAEAIRPLIYDSEKKWNLHDHDRLRLITIGSGSSLKGNEIILKTANLLKNKLHVDFEWRVTTNAESMKFYEDVVNIHHEDVNLNLLGHISTESIVRELCEADIYIHPAIIDNSPNTLCEAQLIGIPVIATNVGGIPQIVENDKTGILYSYNESYALAFAIMNLYNDREKMVTLSKNEYDMSHVRHNPQIIVKDLQNIYSNIIDDFNHK